MRSVNVGRWAGIGLVAVALASAAASQVGRSNDLARLTEENGSSETGTNWCGTYCGTQWIRVQQCFGGSICCGYYYCSTGVYQNTCCYSPTVCSYDRGESPPSPPACVNND